MRRWILFGPRRLTAGTAAERPPSRTISLKEALHHRVAHHAAETPDRTAVLARDGSLTYAELDVRSSRLANRLRALGVGPDVRIGLLAERSLDLVVGLLGILQAGGAYVPIDPSTPARRASLMLADAGARALVTSRSLQARRPPYDGPVLEIAAAAGEEDPHPSTASTRPVSGRSLAYVIYTSGTTGRPKGVMVEHASVLRLMEAMRRRLGVTAEDTVLGLTTPAFDLSVPDFFLPLTTGARLLLATAEETADPERLAALVDKATIVQATPATWRMLLDAGWSGNPRLTAVSGGDALSEDLAWALLARTRALWNFYGPTEATVWASSEPVRAGQSVGLGEPFPGVSVTLRDDHLAPVEDGATGEICVGGWGLARGYLGRPDLTAERFVTDAAGERLYRTGDLARRLPDGRLRFVGRADTQVKVRGHRIELGEIEALLARHPAVAEAAVLAREDRPGDVRLVAYVVGTDGEPDAEALRRHLAEHLPSYMLPSAFVALGALPLTDRLKVDRAALPAPSESETAGLAEAGRDAPATETERDLAALWRDVLDVSVVGRDDTFAALGGHSLLAVRLVAKIRRRWAVALTLPDVFRYPTLRELADELDRQLDTAGGVLAQGDELPLRTERQRGPLSSAQRRLWFLDRLHPGRPLYIIAHAFRLRGPLDAGVFQTALDRLAERHDGLRTRLVVAADGEPEQVVDAHAAVPLRTLEADEADVDALLVREASQPFRLDRDAPLRATLMHLGEDDHALLLAIHHAAADGWSMPILFEDLARLYTAAAHGREPSWGQTPLRPLDYALWQREQLGGPDYERLFADWRRALAGAPPVSALPTDHPRPDELGHVGARMSTRYDADGGVALDAFARREGVTPFIASLTAYAVLLALQSRQNDLVIGVNTSARERAGAEDAVGLYVNMVPVRIRLDPAGTWRDALATVREAALDAFSRAVVPFEHVVEAVSPARRPGATPLVQTVFTLDDARDRTLGLPGIAETPIPLDLGTATFDLVVDLRREGDALRGVLEYRTDLYDPSTARALLTDYGVALESLLQGVDRPTAALGRSLEEARERTRTQAAAAHRSERRQALGALRRRSP